MKTIIITVAFAACLLQASGLNADTMGLSGSYTVMRGEVTYQADGADQEKYDTEISRMAFGVFFNVGLDSDKLVSYRINCNVYIFDNENTSKEETNTKITFKGAGAALDNTLAFNFLRSNYIILWAGPVISFGYGMTNKIRYQTAAASFSEKGSYEEYFIAAAGSIGAIFKVYDILNIEVNGGYRVMPLSTRFKTSEAKNMDTLYGFPYGPYIEFAVSLTME